MTPDVFAFFAALGVELPATGGADRSVRCFAGSDDHANGDRSPSCSVNVDTGAWHCFTCGARGGAYDAALVLGRAARAAAGLVKAHGLWRDSVGDHRPDTIGHSTRDARRRVGSGRVRNSAREVSASRDERDAQRARVRAAPLPSPEQVDTWARALQAQPALLDRVRVRKGWTPGALGVLGVGWGDAGWSIRGERFTLPIYDATGDLVNVVGYLPGHRVKSLALKGRPRDLFPAPERLRTDGHELFDGGDGPAVWIVEGEGDAVAAQSLDPSLYAFAVPGSGGWKAEWCQRFAGMQVAVLCDHDAPGRALTDRVEGDLDRAGVAVRTLAWPTVSGRDDLPSGFDLSDHLLGLAA